MSSEIARFRDLAIARFVVVTLLVAVSGFAQDVSDQATPVASAVVPVVGTVPGVGETVWRTEVTVYNTTGADAFIAVSLLSDPEQSFLSTQIAAGESMSFTDVSQEAFGKTGILSPLVIQTVGTRSVAVNAVAYAIHDGQVSIPQAIPVIYGDQRRGIMKVGPVSFDEEFRTNIGLVNLGDTPVSFTLSVQRIPGRNLAVETLTVGPRMMIHSPVQILFPLLTEATDLTIVVDPGAPNTYAYASIIRNSDHQARFVAPR